MANKNRGEFEVELAGTKFVLLASFDAICQLEDRLDMGLPALLVRISERKRFGIKELTAIFHCGMGGLKNAPSFEEVGNLVMKTNKASLQQPAYLFLGELWYQGQPDPEPGAGEGNKEEKKPEAQP
jgi:hypothetical protein